MERRQQISSRVSVALVVAVALAVAWGTLAAWGGAFVAQFLKEPWVYESIVVRSDGTPVIQSQTLSSYRWIQTYRTLDGKPVTIDSSEQFPFTSFAPASKPPGLFEYNVRWSDRIAGVGGGSPAAFWFAVRDTQPLGRVYLVGYDGVSNAVVGYIARNGFSRVLPPHDQWFEIGRASLAWGNSALASATQIAPAAKSYSSAYASSSGLPPSCLYVVDGDQVMEVHLGSHSVRPVVKATNIAQVAVAYELPPALQSATATEQKGNDGQTMRVKTSDMVARIAALSDDRVIVINPSNSDRREYPLNGSFRGTYFSGYLLASGELLVNWHEKDAPPGETQLAWLRTDGSIARQEKLSLAPLPQPNEKLAIWSVVPAAPVAVGWLAGVGVIGPLAMVQSNEVATYSEGLTKLIGLAGLPLVAVVAVSLACAWQTIQLQRKYHRNATGVWATFVFLLGVPGFVAYLVEHRRPKMEECGACHKVVPRDREACASCHAEFAPPPLVGTEILA